MIRVLQVFGEPLSNGGQESFIMNMYRNMDRNKIQFDFFTPYYCEYPEMKTEIEQLDGKVFLKNKEFSTKRRKKDFIKELNDFLRNNQYDIVHIHSGSIFALAYGAKIAKKNNVKKIIVHSHATGINNLKYKVIKILSRRIFINNVTNYLACSREAAEWKYPHKIIKNNKYEIIKNGIELDKYKFSKEIREKYREELKIKDKFVIGNVGRLTAEKNHIFLVEVFNEIHKKDKNSVLLLVGGGGKDAAGAFEENIKEKVKEYNLQDSVIFLGSRNDVSNILQAMDVFVFPSLYEGLGIVAVESQAAGLVTFCSENIPKEAKLTELLKKINLNEGAKKWSEEILKSKKNKRIDTTKIIEAAGYNAADCAKSMEQIYL